MTGPLSSENLQHSAPGEADVRAALARVLASGPFQNNESLSRLLRTAVEECLAGRERKLKDAQSAKLRDTLTEYYSREGKRDPVRIELSAAGPPVFTSVAAPPRRKRVYLLWAPVLLALCILLYRGGSVWRARAASAAVRSLAVLPFVDETVHKSDAWFASGLSQQLTDVLSRIPSLHVKARPSPSEAASNAEALVTGVIQAKGDLLHVAVSLTRAADHIQLWTGTFDQPAEALPQAIATALAHRIQVTAPVPSASRHRPAAPAYDALLQGLAFFDSPTREDLDKAVERFQESIRLDPEFALAWARLSIARQYRVARGMARPNQVMPSARDAAERAVALDPECGEAHLALGIVKLQYDWDWATAQEELERALKANPGSALVLQWHARWLLTQGRGDQALAELQQALALNPISASLLCDLATHYLAIHQPERATPLVQKAAEIDPSDTAIRALLAETLLSAHAETVRQMLPGLPDGQRAYLTARLGDATEARRILDEAEDLPDEQLMPPVAYVELAGAMGDADRFFSWIAEAIGGRDGQLPYLRWSPVAPKSDPRFQEFLTQMNLPAAAR